MIYILEFSRPFHHARYYVGFCTDSRDYTKRIQEHRSGQGAKIVRAALAAGIDFSVVGLLQGDRSRERSLKRMKNTPRLVRLMRKGKVKGIIACLS